MLSQTGKLPPFLIPFLAVALILVCLVAMIVLILDIRKGGANKYHAAMFFLATATVIVVGFGPSMWHDIRTQAEHAVKDAASAVEKAADATRVLTNIEQGLSYMRSLINVMPSSAGAHELERSMKLASTIDEKVLAFQLYGARDPSKASAWINNAQNLLFAQDIELARRLEKESKVLLDNQTLLIGAQLGNLRDFEDGGSR